MVSVSNAGLLRTVKEKIPRLIVKASHSDETLLWHLCLNSLLLFRVTSKTTEAHAQKICQDSLSSTFLEFITNSI